MVRERAIKGEKNRGKVQERQMKEQNHSLFAHIFPFRLRQQTARTEKLYTIYIARIGSRSKEYFQIFFFIFLWVWFIVAFCIIFFFYPSCSNLYLCLFAFPSTNATMTKTEPNDMDRSGKNLGIQSQFIITTEQICV